MLNEMIYIVVGALFILIQMFIHNKLVKMGQPMISVPEILMLICNASIMFAIMWVYGSLVEFEVQAAFMGLVFYGGFGIIVGIIGFRMLKKDSKKESVES